MIQSEKSQGSTHDLANYAMSKEVIVDLPRIMGIYEKLIPVLLQYQHYYGAWSVIVAVQDAQQLMKLQLAEYRKIHANKGKVDNE